MKPSLSPEYEEATYEIKSIAGKGQAVIASRAIRRGSRIMAEKPLVKIMDRSRTWSDVDAELATQSASLSKQQQDEYMSLHNNFTGTDRMDSMERVGIYQTNALPCGEYTGCVVPTASRINHSCLPNAVYKWREDLDMEVVHALRDMAPGEEITVAYDANTTSQARWEHFGSHFGFVCDCRLCRSSPEKIEQSDMRRQEIVGLEAVIEARDLDGSDDDETWETLANCRNLIGLFEEEYGDEGATPPGAIGPYYVACGVARKRLDDLERASVFIRKAWETTAVCEGKDSPGALELRALIEEPTWEDMTKLVDGRFGVGGCNVDEDWLWGRSR